jgi:hypothetical protein
MQQTSPHVSSTFLQTPPHCAEPMGTYFLPVKLSLFPLIVRVFSFQFQFLMIFFSFALVFSLLFLDLFFNFPLGWCGWCEVRAEVYILISNNFGLSLSAYFYSNLL